ncbi:MAG: hypothetical protein CL878_14220 [Dehalococcoidia bacterium]|nr:hypothetical protein [Dehalococcoidia bacterium]
MAGRLLAPLDGSRLAETVLPYVATIAPALQLEVVLLQAAGRGGTPQQSKAYLDTVSERLAAFGISALVLPASGPPEDAILDSIAQLNVHLVLMATHGRSGLEELLYGSVTHKVIRNSPVPVLAVREPEPETTEAVAARSEFAPKALRSLLVPLDGSPPAEAILPWVKELARELKATLTLLRVDLDRIEPGQEQFPAEQMYLAQIQKQLADEGIRADTVVAVGDPVQEICRHVQEHDVDLLAMVTHGRTGLSLWLTGSVAEAALRSAPATLLLRRPGNAADEAVVVAGTAAQGDKPSGQ